MLKNLVTDVCANLLLVGYRFQLWCDTRGQDLVEYALMAGFVAVAAGAIFPGVSTSVSKILSKVASEMTRSASQS